MYSPEKLTCPGKINGWKMMEDVFPIEIVLFLGDMLVFRGVNLLICVGKCHFCVVQTRGSVSLLSPV